MERDVCDTESGFKESVLCKVFVCLQEIMSALDILTLITLYAEVVLFAYIEKKLWKTVYTPLNILMIPYAFVAAYTMLLSRSDSVADFFYPSLCIWIIGLPLFAFPSWLLALYLKKKERLSARQTAPFKTDIPMRFMNILSITLVGMFMLRLVYMLHTSEHAFGTDEFGNEFCGNGIWGHLHRVLHVLVIFYIYKFDKEHKYYLLILAGMFLVTFLYGVKAWIIVPFIAGMMMRIYTGKTKLKFSLILYVVLFAVAVFYISYFLSLLIGRGDKAADVSVIADYVLKAFNHYVISGVMGLSQDMELGILEEPHFGYVVANVQNVFSVITGDEIISANNEVFINNGLTASNVRTFFGTVYINTDALQFVMMILIYSSFSYAMMLWAQRSNSLFVNMVHFFYMAMLFMGWFDHYYFHILMFEFPFWVFAIYFSLKLLARYGRFPKLWQQ